MNPRPSRRARVRIDGRSCGVLEELPHGGSRFTYDDAWLEAPDAPAVSLTMPLRTEPYESRTLLPFFANLLPEGWLLEVARTKLKVSREDAFGILVGTCADCIGAVEVVPMDDPA